MSNESELKEMMALPTKKMVILSLVTLGLYQALWIDKATRHIKFLTGKEAVTSTYSVIILALFAFSSQINVIAQSMLAGRGYRHNLEASGLMSIMAMILGFAVGVMLIVYAFKASKLLNMHTLETHAYDLKFNRYLLFLFNIYYINYKINELPEVIEKAELLSKINDPARQE